MTLVNKSFKIEVNGDEPEEEALILGPGNQRMVPISKTQGAQLEPREMGGLATRSRESELVLKHPKEECKGRL